MRNRIGWRERLARFQGSSVERDLGSYDEALAAINSLDDELRPLTDGELDRRARSLGERARSGGSLDPLRDECFALVREASRRALGERPFDVQVAAALALHRGRIVEMQTGEGKTLAAVMPAALQALTGEGVHVLTFNDYLARRDAGWMGPVYRRLGLTVGFVEQGMPAARRRAAYRADVTYVTAKEAGFDFLRDSLAMNAADLVHRAFHFAIVDEADSLLVDEARVPLVIAGAIAHERSSPSRLAALVAPLVAGVDYDCDEYARDVELTEAGIARAERELACGSLHDDRNLALLTELNCALHARVLLHRDVDYLVRDGRLEMIDDFTGRAVKDRHWPDGLQAALEAKEGLTRQADGAILGSITLQHFLASYPRMCGMTGTAADAAEEFAEFYGLRVVVVPTNRRLVRVDHEDVVFRTRDAKERAVAAETARAHATGRPVLVGTLTVEESERLAARLRSAGVSCEILNASNDAMEAEVVAKAGTLGAVTISTNMAGRGTDIRLGGSDPSQREAVAALGGLYVIGTNRHESRRVDLQLRGRAGRQGDPGESRFFVSLEDELPARFGIRELIARPVASLACMDPVDDPLPRREIARAQRIAEGQNFEIRRTLWRYAKVVEDERRMLMTRRLAVLSGEEEPDLWRRSPNRYGALVTVAGEKAVREAERKVTLFHIDRAWREHLAFVADLREGIHLVSLGGGDPLTHFTREAVKAFDEIDSSIDEGVAAALEDVRVAGRQVDLTPLDLKGPASTWTYLVNDDPFRNQIGRMLTGPGRSTVAIAAAAAAMPLLMLWALVDRIRGPRPGRRPGPLRE
jgi:preprotein translocase subunit SecA